MVSELHPLYRMSWSMSELLLWIVGGRPQKRWWSPPHGNTFVALERHGLVRYHGPEMDQQRYFTHLFDRWRATPKGRALAFHLREGE